MTRPIGLRLASTAMYLLVAQLLIGCDTGPQPARANVKALVGARIALIGQSHDDAAWPAVIAAARHALRDYPGVQLEPVVPKGPGADAYLECVRKIGKTKPSAACLWSLDDAVGGAVQALQAAGVPVVAVGPLEPSSAALARVAVDYSEAAELLGANLPKLVGSGSSYMLAHEQGRSPLAERARIRFRVAAEGHRHLSRLLERSVFTDGSTPGDQILAMLSEFPHTASA